MKRYKALFLVIFLSLFLIAGILWANITSWKDVALDLGLVKERQGGSFIGDFIEKIPGKSSYSPVEHIPEDELTTPDLILLGARREVENGTRYDASYVSINYPGGDVEPNVGACTDVVVRAFRFAGIDLQQLIHEDMKENFHLYPNNWGLNAPDPNIDHRRVPNQMLFFERFGTVLTLKVEDHLHEWQWGDVVYWRFPNGRDHCGIISDRTGKNGVPLVIHNASITREEDSLLRWEIIGHFRYQGY